MPASEARIRANQSNALKSTGPKTPEGKETSRANSYKHGLTGAGVVLPNREAAEVDRRHAAFCEELGTYSSVGQALARLAATMSVRAERCADHENAELAARARQALADFEPPEGLDAAGVARLRNEAENRVLFDPSPEATLARRYEATAVRTFLRALKELNRMKREAEQEEEEALGSFLPGEMTHDEFDALCLKEDRLAPRQAADSAVPGDFLDRAGHADVPFTIGRRR